MASKLPKEALDFAKQMGLNLNEMKPEAQDIWRMLNEMHSRSPAEYDSFVQQTFEEHKEENLSGNDTKEQKVIRPTAGLSVITNTIGGNDGIKVRDVDSKGKILFVNLCTHEALQKPKDQNNKEVSSVNVLSTDGFEIPMMIGKARDIESTSLVIDVLVHPIVLELSKIDKKFHKQLIDLALESTKSESGIEMNLSDWKISNKFYEGGRGDDKSIPALFPVSNPSEDSNESKKRQNVLSNPSNLMKSIQIDNENIEIDCNTILSNLQTQNSTGKSPKSRLVSEVGRDDMIDETLSPPVIELLKPILGDKPLIEATKTKFKKGFLNNATIIDENLSEKVSVDSKPLLLPSKQDVVEIDKLFNELDDEWSTQVVQNKSNSNPYDINFDDLMVV